MGNIRRNFVFVLGVNFINGLAGIAFIPLALTSLGAEGYGIYSIFGIFTAYIYFVEMGVSKYFTRQIAQSTAVEEERTSLQVANGIYIRIIGVLLLLTPFLYYIVPKYIFPTESTFLIGLIVIFSTLDYILSIPTTIQLTYNVGKEYFEKVSKYNLVAGLTKHMLLLIAVLLSNSVLIVILVALFRRITDMFFSFKILQRVPKGSWKPEFNQLNFISIIKGSSLLSITQILQMTILTIGTFLINRNFSLKEVGIYNSVYDLATKVWFFSNSLGLVIFPRFASITKNEEDRINLLTKLPTYHKYSWTFYHAFFLLAFLIVPILPNFLLISDLTLFFLILYGVCLNAHSNFSYEFLQANAKMKEVISVGVITLLTIIFMFQINLSSHGMYAIGIAWITSQLIGSLLMDLLVIKELKMKSIVLTLLFQLSFVLAVIWFVF